MTIVWPENSDSFHRESASDGNIYHSLALRCMLYKENLKHTLFQKVISDS